MGSEQNDSFAGWRVHPSMLCDGKQNSGWLGYTLYMYGICLENFINLDWLIISAKKMMNLPSWVRTCMYRSPPMLGTWYHPRCILFSMNIISSAAILRAFLVSQVRLDDSDLDSLRILSVLATESPPTLGQGLPKLHSQSLISQTWLPLQGLGRQHIRIRRPASVVPRTCTE